MNHDYIKEFNLIDQYVLGKLAANQAEEFEDHYIDCPECVEQLNITRSFIQDLKGLAVQETLLTGNRRTPVTRQGHFQLVPRSWAVIGCCCILVLGVFAFFAFRRWTQMEAELRQAKEGASAIRQEYQRGLETASESERQHQEARQQLAQKLDDLEQKLKTEGAANQPSVRGPQDPEINFPIYALVSLARGQGAAPVVEFAPPASSSRFALSIPVEDRTEYSVYRVTILDYRGVTVFSRVGFKPDAYHALSLSLNSNFLIPGTYELRVEGLTPPNKWNTVGSYQFRIARRP